MNYCSDGMLFWYPLLPCMAMYFFLHGAVHVQVRCRTRKRISSRLDVEFRYWFFSFYSAELLPSYALLELIPEYSFIHEPCDHPHHHVCSCIIHDVTLCGLVHAASRYLHSWRACAMTIDYGGCSHVMPSLSRVDFFSPAESQVIVWRLFQQLTGEIFVPCRDFRLRFLGSHSLP
jgi:hypothetical protein